MKVLMSGWFWLGIAIGIAVHTVWLCKGGV